MSLDFFFEYCSFGSLFPEACGNHYDRFRFRSDAFGDNFRHCAGRYHDYRKIDGFRQRANRLIAQEATDFRPAGIYGVDPAFEAAEQVPENRVTYASCTIRRSDQSDGSRRKDVMQPVWITMGQLRTHKCRLSRFHCLYALGVHAVAMLARLRTNRNHSSTCLRLILRLRSPRPVTGVTEGNSGPNQDETQRSNPP